MKSKTQLDKLGDALKEGGVDDASLKLLDEYRLSFSDAYGTVVDRIRARIDAVPTGRPAKSTTAIVEKLRRETIRLTQLQDIAGCRIVVPDIAHQDRVVREIAEVFPDATIVIDRREKPSHGYRAVHVIVRVGDRVVETQVRTQLQHRWAELSEKLADLLDPSLKYGGGPEATRKALQTLSDQVAIIERLEREWTKHAENLEVAEKAVGLHQLEAIRKIRSNTDAARAQLEEYKRGLSEQIGDLIRIGEIGSSESRDG